MHATTDYPPKPPTGSARDFSDGQGPEPTPSRAFGEAINRFAELRDYVAYFLAAKLDAIRLTVRNIAVLAVIGVIGLVAVAALIVTSVVMILNGIAGGLGLLMGQWGANLLTGGVVLIALPGRLYWRHSPHEGVPSSTGSEI